MEYFRARFEIPIPDEAARNGAFYRPPDDSPEMRVHARAPPRAGRLHAGAQVRADRRSRRPPLEYFDESLRRLRRAAKSPPPWRSSAC